MKKMVLLTDVLDSLVCPASSNNGVDPIFSVGLALNGTPPRAKDAAELADLQRQAYGVSMLKQFRKPRLPGVMGDDEYKVWGSDKVLVNDLYVPGYSTDEDGFTHIYFPVPINTHLSSTFLAKDWRFVALAWIAVIDSKIAPAKMVFNAVDASGRRVVALVEPEVLDAFKTVLKMNLGDREVPGPVCRRCAKVETCKTLNDVLDPHLNNISEPLPKDKSAVAQSLFFQRMDIETQLEILEDRRQKIDQSINRLCVEGTLKIGSESILLPRRKVKQFDFSKVFRILREAGLWHDSYANIRVTQLVNAMADFPEQVRKELEDSMIETTTEPSISEAAKHGRTVRTVLLRGVTKVR